MTRETPDSEHKRPRYQTRRPKKSIKLDKVDPQDFMQLNIIYCCEQCGHYSPSTRVCTMGFRPQHTRAEQLALYDLTGKMAFCRFIEID